MEKLIAIYPGTFDPITLGHLDVINRAASIFSNLVIAVAEDTNKSPIFSLEERVSIVEKEIQNSVKSRTNLIVKPFKGLLIDFAEQQNAKVILRGMRALSDFEYEFQMAFMNNKLAPNIQTFFIPASEKGHFISSRFVKELARLRGDLSKFVSKDVEKKLIDYYQNA
jgi:pantetheine-phosphate adenylyltransferase